MILAMVVVWGDKRNVVDMRVMHFEVAWILEFLSVLLRFQIIEQQSHVFGMHHASWCGMRHAAKQKVVGREKRKKVRGSNK